MSRARNTRRSRTGIAAHVELDLEVELESHHTRSFGWALSCCGWDRDEAGDVLQMSYLKILDGRASFAQRSAFSTFLFGVIRRTASERRRQRTTRNVLLLRHFQESEATTKSAPESLPVDVKHLQQAVAALPRRQREVVHLVFYDDLTIREAAEIMEVGIGSARVHYERAKKRLREGLGEAYEQGVDR